MSSLTSRSNSRCSCRTWRRSTAARSGPGPLTCWKQAVFALAWFRDRPDIRRHGRAEHVSGDHHGQHCQHLRPDLLRELIPSVAGSSGPANGQLPGGAILRTRMGSPLPVRFAAIKNEVNLLLVRRRTPQTVNHPASPAFAASRADLAA